MFPLLRSRLLGSVPRVFHAFTTREGGVSQGPYASLNLGLTFGGGDEPARVDANRQLLREALGATQITGVRQVHGHTVVDAQDANPTVQADGLFTSRAGLGLLVLVADCVPVLLARRDGSAVAAVHAGWRGAVARIASRGVDKLGTADVVAALGPCIGPCCFEVGPEVVDACVAVAGPSVVTPGPRGKPHVDLRAVVRADLVAAGVPAEQVENVGGCTVCRPEFFSHRRDAGVTGRQGGVVGLSR